MPRVEMVSVNEHLCVKKVGVVIQTVVLVYMLFMATVVQCLIYAVSITVYIS